MDPVARADQVPVVATLALFEVVEKAPPGESFAALREIRRRAGRKPNRPATWRPAGEQRGEGWAE